MRVPACAAALALAAFVLGASPAPSPSLLPSTSPASAWPSASPVPAPSGSASARPKTALETPYYRVETDTIVWHGKSGDFDMPHHVAFSRPGSDGTADSAKGNEKAGTITLAGNVVLHDSGNAPEAGPDAADYARGGPATLTCDKLAVDSKAKIYNAEGHVHFEQGTRTATAERG
ncbi:MAG: hypothetical protein JOZ24_08450, partial [Candidatus Eremiobacteraeota bacterium]|nr:hypothetical protein [Candidatus Eremiobacteraeota bacterium]